jgi:hypothetical protein
MTPGGQARFIKQRWPDGMVVFDTLSGDTHAMDTELADGFELFLREPGLLAQGLSAFPGMSPVAFDALQRLLERLDLGLYA